jgi:hypothetical protein
MVSRETVLDVRVHFGGVALHDQETRGRATTSTSVAPFDRRDRTRNAERWRGARVRRLREPVHVDRCVSATCGGDRIGSRHPCFQKWTLTQPRSPQPLRQFGGSLVLERTATVRGRASTCDVQQLGL